MATIASAGGMPERLRKLCDGGSVFLKENGAHFFNAQVVGDSTRCGREKRPQTDQDWQRLYFLRRLSERQLRAAHDLGAKLAATLGQGRPKPHKPLGAFASAVAKLYLRSVTLYEIVGDEREEAGDGDPPPRASAPPGSGREKPTCSGRRSRAP